MTKKIFLDYLPMLGCVFLIVFMVSLPIFIGMFIKYSVTTFVNEFFREDTFIEQEKKKRYKDFYDLQEQKYPNSVQTDSIDVLVDSLVRIGAIDTTQVIVPLE